MVENTREYTLLEDDQLPMEKNARPLWNTPCSHRCGGGTDAPHQQEQPPFLAGVPTPKEEEQHIYALHHQVKELSWLCQQLQQEIAGWMTTGRPLIHQCLMEQLAALVAKRAKQIQQAVRRDLERKASRAQDESILAERREAPRDRKHNNRGEHEPRVALVSYHQAERARAGQHYALALEGYSHAIAFAPRLTLAYHGRAEVYQASQLYQRALADYGWILHCDPHDALAYYQRGAISCTLKHYEQALIDYHRAIALEPDHVLALLARAEVYLLLKNKALAAKDFASAAACEPDNGYAAWMAVFTSFDRERPGDAIIAHLETLATRYAPTEEGALCQGIALGLRGRWHAGLIVLEQMLAEEPSSAADGYFWHGMLLAMIGAHTAAHMALEQALRRGLPPVLLTPLRWLEPEQPTFYREVALPLLSQLEAGVNRFTRHHPLEADDRWSKRWVNHFLQ